MTESSHTRGRDPQLDPRVTLAVLGQLVALTDHRSLGALARQLGLSQPTISSNLNRLEDALGFPLVIRGPRGSTLTEDGLVVVEAARDLLAEGSRLAATIADLRSVGATELRLAASLTIAEQLVPRWLADHGLFGSSEQTPHVEVAVGNSDEVMEWVSGSKADVGFVGGNRVRAGLSYATVGRDELVVVVARGHPWSERRKPVGPAELVRGGLVVREQGSGTLEVLVQALGRAGVSLPRDARRFGSTSAILTAVRYSGAAAVTSALAVADDVSGGKLAIVPTSGLDFARTFTAVWRPDTALRREAAQLVSGLSRRFTAP